MKIHFYLGSILAVLLFGWVSGALAGGTVNFANKSSARVLNGQTGTNVVSGDNVRVGLYWSPISSNNFSMIGAYTNVGVPLPGIFAGGTRTTGPATAGGAQAKFQVRAWESPYTNFEEGVTHSGKLIGTSGILTLFTGDPGAGPPTPPASLIAAGLQSFTVTQSVLTASLTLTCASNKTVACGIAWTFDSPNSSSTCSNTTVTVIVLSTVTNGQCPQVITRTWRATDSCLNTNTCSQIVTVTDNVQPTLTCATNKTVQCGSAWSFDTPAASDACCGTNVTVTVQNTVTNGSGCAYTVTRTWLATDCCTNSSSCTQTVSVVDTTPPTISCSPITSVQCGSPLNFGTPTASDSCSGTNVTVTILSTTTNGSCPQMVTRTWLATDACGNTNTCSRTINVIDSTPPTMTCSSNKTVQCGSGWSFDAPTASDICCGTNVTVTVQSTLTNGSGCSFMVTRTWHGVDCCNNSANCSQIVTVIDATPPTITCATNKTVNCATNWSFDAPTASDTCSTNITVTVLSTVTNGICQQAVTRTWLATDGCGNSNTCAQVITVTCADSPAIQVTKSCPTNPVPPGGTLVFTGTVTNSGNVLLTNVLVVNDKPIAGTLIFGPVSLAAGAGAAFSGSYSVAACSCGPHIDTLIASGASPCGTLVSNTATVSCAGTNVFAVPGDINGDGIVDQSELNAVLSNYWAHSPWIYMTNPTSLGGGYFQFALTNAAGWNFTVLVSSNLNDWSNLPGPAYPVYQFYDPAAASNAPNRYYRLRYP